MTPGEYFERIDPTTGARHFVRCISGPHEDDYYNTIFWWCHDDQWMKVQVFPGSEYYALLKPISESSDVYLSMECAEMDHHGPNGEERSWTPRRYTPWAVSIIDCGGWRKKVAA